MNKDKQQLKAMHLNRRSKKRYRAEVRFKLYGILALSIGLMALFILAYNLLSAGHTAFWQTRITADVNLDRELLMLEDEASQEDLQNADYYSLFKALQKDLTDAASRLERKELSRLFSSLAEDEVRDYVLTHPEKLGERVKLSFLAASDLDMLHKGVVDSDSPAIERGLSDYQFSVYKQWLAEGRISTTFNWSFFLNGDSREPEQAGLGAALLGSCFTLLICLLISFPLGVGAALYLEEFAPKGKLSDLIEVNINNLAAVPSIIFGLLGLALLLNIFNLPRGTPLVGGIVLSFMTLPSIIVACRASLKAVPPSIREAALALGASPVQVVIHHVLPLAMPGTLTGTIIGLARALGETAPLLMIGMVAFIADFPKTPLDPAAALPVQIYLWAESAEKGFVEKTSAAIIIILLFLVLMNILAVILRQKYERRW